MIYIVLFGVRNFLWRVFLKFGVIWLYNCLVDYLCCFVEIWFVRFCDMCSIVGEYWFGG